MGNKYSEPIDYPRVSLRTFHEIVMGKQKFRRVSIKIHEFEMKLYSLKIIIGKDNVKFKIVNEYKRNKSRRIFFAKNYFIINDENSPRVNSKIFKIPSLTKEQILKQKPKKDFLIENFCHIDSKFCLNLYHENRHYFEKKDCELLRKWCFEENFSIVFNDCKQNYKFLLLVCNNIFLIIYHESTKYYHFIKECRVISGTEYELILKSKNHLIIHSYFREKTYISIHKISKPTENYIPSVEKVTVVCKNEKRITLDKSFIRFLKSDFLNSQMENGDEIFIPSFNEKDINVSNLKFLDYIGSGIYQDCEEYINFCAL